MLHLRPTDDGSLTLRSELFGEYHSVHGARTESEYVFLENGLYYWLARQPENRALAILEAGFGTGLNALLSLLAAERLSLDLQYTGYEAYPIAPELAARLDYPALLGAPGHADDFMRMHTCQSGETLLMGPHFRFCKVLGRFEWLDAESVYDVVYFDAFSPNAQPELWSAETLGRMYRALRPGGVWVTYCAKGEVRRTLQAVGFAVEKIPGPPGKRHILRGVKE